jgi:SAM-dependent methyltransferase
LLQSADPGGPRGNLLEIHHAAAPPFEPALLDPAPQGFGLMLSLSQDGGNPGRQRVRCASGQLPFQDHAFRVVVLHHVVGDGDEAELAEAVRVLSPRGLLLVLGLNRMGWRYRVQNKIDRLPGLAPLRVRARLEQLGVEVHGCAGAGLGGRQRPALIRSGLASMAMPVSDVLLLQARPVDRAAATPLRLRKVRHAVVQSAPIRG